MEINSYRKRVTLKILKFPVTKNKLSLSIENKSHIF